MAATLYPLVTRWLKIGLVILIEFSKFKLISDIFSEAVQIL